MQVFVVQSVLETDMKSKDRDHDRHEAGIDVEVNVSR